MTSFAQKHTGISLKNEPLIYQPSLFQVKDVVDDRTPAGSLGVIRAGGEQAIFLMPDAATAIRLYLSHNATNDAGTLPGLTMHIVDLRINDRSRGSAKSAECVYRFAFYKDGTEVGGAAGSTSVKTSSELSEALERLIRRAIGKALETMDSRMPRVNGVNKDGQQTRVSVTIGRKPESSDELAYRPGLKLAFADFRSRQGSSDPTEAGFTNSGISMSINAGVHGGVPEIAIVLTPFFSKNRSFIREDARNAAVLAHEQAHLDITGILACRLRDALLAAGLDLSNYETKAREIYKQMEIDGDARQQQYDEETNHGLKKQEQAAWEERLRKEVEALHCY